MADCLHEASALKIRLTTFLSILALFYLNSGQARPGPGRSRRSRRCPGCLGGITEWEVTRRLQSGDAEHLVRPVDAAVLPGLAGGEAGDTQGVLGVPGVRPHGGPGRSVAA